MPKLLQRREYEYRVSPKVTLTPGVKFRVNKGPYYKQKGVRIPMSVRGVLTFISVICRGKQKYIECWSKEGYEVLHMLGKRKSLLPSLTCRPYKVTKVFTKGKRNG